MHNVWHLVQCFLSQYGWIRRYCTPSEKFKTFLGHNDLKHLLGLILSQLIMWKEKHTNTIFPFFTNIKTQFLSHFLKKSVRNLKHNTNTITGLALGILTCTMFQCFYDGQCILNSLMCLDTLNIHNCTDTTCIMFKRRII